MQRWSNLEKIVFLWLTKNTIFYVKLELLKNYIRSSQFFFTGSLVCVKVGEIRSENTSAGSGIRRGTIHGLMLINLFMENLHDVLGASQLRWQPKL